MNTRENSTKAIQYTNKFFLNKAQKQVNVAMTLRNWLIGNYIVEYVQLGEERTTYGQMVLETLADRLTTRLERNGGNQSKTISAALFNIPSNSSDSV